MNYNRTECHNPDGIGRDTVWYNIEINDLTEEQIESILALIKPWYTQTIADDLADHIAYMNTHAHGACGCCEQK
jgi:hypothetical protein